MISTPSPRFARGLVPLLALALAGCHAAPATNDSPAELRQLPTGVRLAPIGQSTTLGSMPLSMIAAPGGRRAVVLLGGWREQGIQVLDTRTGAVTQTVLQPAAFVGMAFSPDGRTLYVSGGDQDVVYRYDWAGDSAHLRDSLVLAVKRKRANGTMPPGTRYPTGLALSPDGRSLYVAENLSDSLAVIDVASGDVKQRLATGRYPYGVVAGPSGQVFVSVWGATAVATFTAQADGRLVAGPTLGVSRHPSAMLLNRDGSRLFIASGSTDKIAIVDTRTNQLVGQLQDTPPGAPGEGSTPNALALSNDGVRLFVAEADNNAVAVFDLDGRQSGVAAAAPVGRLAGRVPTAWYPTGVIADGSQLLVITGKGNGTGPNRDGPTPAHARGPGDRGYTLGQTTGSFARISLGELAPANLARHTLVVSQLDRWTRDTAAAPVYPPFSHVIYIIKENRTYDQVFGDERAGDGDSTLLFFPRHVSPNHHALAERFGLYDRFFCNAEVSPDGHNWSTAAYVTDYAEKTIPSQYSNRRRDYDYEGTNRNRIVPDGDIDDAAEPANGYLWDLAERAHISFRNYGEFVSRTPSGYVGNKPFLKSTTNPRYAGFDLTIEDQARVDVWTGEFNQYVRDGNLPALEILRLPNDHTNGGTANRHTPFAFMADNDLGLGRIVEAVSTSPYWKNTVIFVVEDDAQNGPDHVDSHRAPFLVISAYNRGGVMHRWTNTADVVETIGDILHLGKLSQFDTYGRPLRDAFVATADTTPYRALRSDVDLAAMNPPGTTGDRMSRGLDFSQEDRADENTFNRALWATIRGDQVPYPGIHRLAPIEFKRSH
jgi:YVTN family beta-propeller protein